MAKKQLKGTPSNSGNSWAGYYDSYSKQKLDPKHPEQFASRMTSFLRSNQVNADSLMAGNIQMLGFDEVKESFGDAWVRVRDRVILLAESIIDKHITKDDVYLLAGGEQFVILFGKATTEEANERAIKVAKEINEKLSGVGEGVDQVSAKPLVMEIPKDKVADMTTAAAIEKTVEQTKDELEGAEVAAFANSKLGFEIHYWPVANVKKRLVSCYYLSIDGEIDRSTMKNPDSGTGRLECEIDRYAVELAGPALSEAEKRGDKALLIVPIQFETLNSKGLRDRLLEECRKLPEVAERRMLFMICGMDNNVPQSKLHTTLSYVSPYAAGFIGQFTYSFRRSDQLGGVSMIGIGVDGGSVDQASDEMLILMAGFIKSNRVGKNRIFFSNAKNVDVATAARKANFDYVQGAGVAPAMKAPGRTFQI